MSHAPKKVLVRNWSQLCAYLPADLATSAVAYGALRRRRAIDSATLLLRLLLMYAIRLSLRDTVIWALALNLCDISRQNLDKRLQACGPWLRHVLQQLLTTLLPPPTAAPGLIGRVHLCDGSSFARAGSPGTEWRLHLGWDPWGQQPLSVDLTDVHTGEGCARLTLRPGDLVVGDRGYGYWRNLALVWAAQAYAIFRVAWNTFPLNDATGAPFDICAWLSAQAPGITPCTCTVSAAADPQARPLRLVAGRLPPDKVAEAQDRARAAARKDHRELQPQTLLLAEFCVVITNLPAACTPAMILAWYRLRWQIEWCFRRWKSLCHLDALPAYPSPLAEVVLYAKLILVVLLQLYLGDLPWTDWWTGVDPAPVVSTLVRAAYTHLCSVLCPPTALLNLFADPTRFLRHLRSSRRKRPLQVAAIADILQNMLHPPRATVPPP